MSLHIDVDKKPQSMFQAGLIIGALKRDLREARRYPYYFALKSRIEFLQNLLSKHITDRISGKRSREEKWLIIMEQNEPALLTDIKKKVVDSGISVENFCKVVDKIGGDSYDTAARFSSMPEAMETDDIIGIVELLGCGIDEFNLYFKTIDILSKPIDIIDDES